MKKILFDLQKLSLLLSLSVFFFSCENPTEIGFDFSGNGNATSYYSDTLNLDVSTVLADSNATGKANYLMMGITEDPVFGTVKSTAYFQPSLVVYTTTTGSTAVDTLTLKANPIADSLRIRLVNTGLIFGDTLSTSYFNVYRLKSPINFSKTFNGNESLEYTGQPLARFGINSKSFRNATYDSLRAFFVKLPTSIAQDVLNLSQAARSESQKFNDALPGFAIVPENSTKAVYTFLSGPFSANTSTFIVNYHYEGDTTKYLYQFDLNGPRHSYLEFNRSSKKIASLSKSKNEIASTATGNLTYVQGGSGISTKINFDKLKKLGSNIKVSKAILDFTLDPSSINPLYPKIYNFVLAEVGTNNQQARNSSNAKMYITPLGTDLSGSVVALLDSTNTVSIDLTNFAQKITNKLSTANSILLMPAVLTTTGNGILADDNLRRVVFTKPKLKIYYTKY